MIYHVEGDILLSKAHVIAQGVSANDRMNHGLAKTLHEHFPPMHKAFHQWCHQHHPKTGEIWVWDALKNRLIVNLIIKDGGYNNSVNSHGKITTNQIRHALHALKKRVAKENFTSIALPRLATSAGELEWAEVLPVIEHELAELEIPVYLYSSYVPHQQAIEPSTH